MSIEDFDKDTIKLAAKALVFAVENVTDDTVSVESRCEPLLKVFDGDCESLETGLTPKKHELFLLNVIHNHGKAFVRRFFGGLHLILGPIVSGEAYVPESAFEEEPDDTRDTATRAENDKRAKICLRFLKYAALCTTASLEGRIDQQQNDKERVSQIHVAPELYDVALQLHNILLSIHDCGEEALATRDAILRLCEEWWMANASNRNSLIAQVLPLLVLQASNPVDFQKAQIIKLLTFKDAFQVIDFLNPSSDSLRALLLKVASNPLCLRLSEGKKFLASLFRDPDLVADLHLSFRAQIPQAPKTILKAYGEIYFKAWCEAEDDGEEETKEAIEHKALQDLMHCAIHIASPAMAKNIMTVLAPIHVEKKTKRVADLLFRLYGPIIWRSLSAANPIVRKNSIVVLEKVFPLHDPSQNQMKAAIEKGIQTLRNALQDGDPKVRVGASQAAANIISLFWDALTATEIRVLLNHIVLEHSSDVTSPAVREQAILTTANILEIPQSHAVLRPLLPSLGNLIHDKNEKVRLAVVKLLRRIKQTPGIHFYHVVPVEHLTARFSAEAKHRERKNAVNRELTALMLSSYFPQGEGVTAGDQIQRTMAFILKDPSAAAAFYANLSDFLEIQSVAKFIVMLLTCLNSAVQSEQAQHVKRTETKKKRRRGNAPAEDENDESQNLSAENTDLMVGLVETIGILIESICIALDEPDNLPSKNLIHSRLREADLVNLLAHFEQKAQSSQSSRNKEAYLDKNLRICRGLLRCISLVPKEIIVGVVDYVKESLKAISRDENASPSYTLSMLSVLSGWGLVDDIACAVSRSIELELDDRLHLSLLSLDGPAGTADERKDTESLLPDFPAPFAFEILHLVLLGNDRCSLDIRGKILISEKAPIIIDSVLLKALNCAERALSSQIGCDDSFCDVDVRLILGCCEAYGRLALHRAFREGQIKLTEEIEKIVDWTAEHVFPVLTGATILTDTDLRCLDLSRISNVSDSLAMGSSSGLMSPPKQRINLGSRSSRLSEVSQNSAFIGGSLIHQLAPLLLQSVSLVVAEFLLIGGSVDEKLVSKLSGWFSILDRPSDDEQASKIKTQLLPGFMRLGVVLAKKAQTFTQLQQTFLNCEGELLEGISLEMIIQSVKSLLPTGLQKESPFMEGLVNTILLFGGMYPDGSHDEFYAVTSADEILPKTCLSVILGTCAKNLKATKHMTDRFLSKLLSHRGDTNNEIVFCAKCLSYLVASMQSETFNEKMVEEINAERTEFEGVRSMLGKIVYAGAK